MAPRRDLLPAGAEDSHRDGRNSARRTRGYGLRQSRLVQYVRLRCSIAATPPQECSGSLLPNTATTEMQ